MRRLTATLILASLFALGGCATYKQDLERAEKHYSENKFEEALALFRVLEDDMDSLSAGDQARYAYTRGMADYRLSALAVSGSGMADPKKSFRMNARHWLAVAAATEKTTPGGLTGDEKTRLDETLADLNREVYGGADTAPDASGTPAASGAPSAGPAAGSSPPAKPSSSGSPAVPGQPSMGAMPGGTPR
jgi:hypothetical protein